MNLDWVHKLMRFLRLSHEQEDALLIQETIEKGVVFKGTNLWILILAILIASVGLNMNSTAVVIGAMLISPLMGPIAGIGYSIATYNFPLFRKAVKNIGFAAFASILTSFLYFLLTPITTEHAELLSRTSPTIYDVFIAFFGGTAGILTISSKNKGNVIPGVAIATALMPPLCTAGYGLAIGNFSYFFGAIYLFTINSVFIALSAMMVSQLLKLPKKTFLLSKEIKNKNIAIGFVILLTIVPSFFLGLSLVHKERFNANANNFIKKVSFWDENYLLKSTVDADKKIITLIYAGNEFDSTSIRRIRTKAEDLNLKGAKIIVEQGVKLKDADKLELKNADYIQLSNQVEVVKEKLAESHQKMDSIADIPLKGEYLLKEIKAFFPKITSGTYAISKQFIDREESIVKDVTLVFFQTTKFLKKDEKEKVRVWLEERLKTKDVIVRFEVIES